MLGWLILFAAWAALALMMYSGIESALRDRDEERVQMLAEERFNEMLENMEFHVVQRLEIKDEMR